MTDLLTVPADPLLRSGRGSNGTIRAIPRSLAGAKVRNREYSSMVRSKAWDRIEKTLIDIGRLPEDFDGDGALKPFSQSVSNAFLLAGYLRDSGLDLTDLMIWPTDNGTVEFSLRRDRNNELSFETGTDGISGLICLSGREHWIDPRSGNVRTEVMRLAHEYASSRV
ncbi:hypothetical protein Uis1B_2224 [Bifidobacterium margollesii]|uniref:Uncharacterized protein n=1 Tax=Bifidobacterium margollesii TaxID=2020964 RepID=A0A2N5J6X3_9BIFI|nr:hypothetical protein [Bifidobacterium margollesii]PLS29956.1 hypothetical protein Uis1B_2224 [Bifidobacterium margollesii]